MTRTADTDDGPNDGSNSMDERRIEQLSTNVTPTLKQLVVDAADEYGISQSRIIREGTKAWVAEFTDVSWEEIRDE